MRGLIVNGGEPEEMIRDVGPWRVRYEFGRTTSGRLGIARIEVAPHRPDGVIPDADGVTLAVMGHVQISAVRSYLWMVNRETKARAKAQKPAKGNKGSMLNRQYRRLLARRKELIEAEVRDYAKVIAKEFGMNRNTVRVQLMRADDMQRG